MILEAKETEKITPLFAGWQETLIWSCLQGVMGHVYTDSLEIPGCGMALLGDFCFLAGEPNRELVEYKPEWCKQDFMIMVPENEEWAELIENCYQERAKRVFRYAIRKEPKLWNHSSQAEKLQQAVTRLPDGYVLKRMDEELFHRCKDIPWCRDWVSQYGDYEAYEKYGLGVVILKDGEPVSGASSYSGYLGGIEIEIDTREDYRRKGLAYICGAKLILACLERGWYPSWDAQNKVSVALAEKLGYHFDHAYPAYEISGYGGKLVKGNHDASGGTDM